MQRVTEALSRRLKSSLSRLQLTTDSLCSLESLILDYEKEDYIKHSIISEITRSSKSLLNEHDVVAKNKKITFRYDAGKQMYVTEIVMTERVERMVEEGEEWGLEEDKEEWRESGERLLEEVVEDKVQSIFHAVYSFCKIKAFSVPLEISMEALVEHHKTYACIYYIIYGRVRNLPIYSQKLEEIDTYLDTLAQKELLGEFLTNQGKESLKKHIGANDLLNTIFEALRNPNFASSKFSLNKKIAFLALLSEALFQKKKFSKRKGKKKTTTEIPTVSTPTTILPQTLIVTQDYTRVLLSINTMNHSDKCSLTICPHYLNQLQQQMHRLSQ